VKISPGGAKFFYEDEWMDALDKANIRFGNFSKAPKIKA
jgi:hypothetical protein